jgi:hypothetical protein
MSISQTVPHDIDPPVALVATATGAGGVLA